MRTVVSDSRRGTIGLAIKRRRESLGLSQEAAAAKAGIEQTNWARWERGAYRPTPVSLERIAEALGVEVSDLIGEVAPC